MKFYQSGRSMVEMLGVLAIIGVLSVGAISGYSKAMMKYKLNKQTEQLNYLMNTITSVYRDFVNYDGSYMNMLPYLKKLNYLPDEMLKENDEDYLYESFGNQYSLGVYNSASWLGSCGAGITIYSNLLNDQSAREVCQNVLRVVKEYQSIIWYVEVTSMKGGTTGAIFGLFNALRPNENYPYLKDVSLTDLYQACYNVEETPGNDQFGVRIWWYGC